MNIAFRAKSKLEKNVKYRKDNYKVSQSSSFNVLELESYAVYCPVRMLYTIFK